MKSLILIALMLLPQQVITARRRVVSSGGGGTFTFAGGSTPVDITSSGSSVTIPSTTTGNVLIVFLNFRSSASDGASSLTGACSGSWILPSGARSTSSAGARAQEIWYCLSASSAATSFVVNYATSGDTVSVTELEYNSTVPPVAFVAANGTTNATFAGGTYTGPSITSTAGAGKGLVVSYFTSGINSCDGPNSPFSNRLDDVHSNSINDALNNGGGSYAMQCPSLSADTTINNGIVAFK